MSNPTLSIVVPGIRTECWNTLVDSIRNTIKDHSFEIIFVGYKEPPENLQDIPNIRFISDFGCPSRAMQIGCSAAQGELLMWACDDAIFNEGSLDDQISNYLLTEKKILNLIYTEGESYKWGGDDRINQPHNWYRGKWHDDFRGLEGIEDCWVSTILFIMRTQYFLDLGGVDCRFETINFNLHDLSYRAIKAGYESYFSDTNRPVMRIEWQQGNQRSKDEPIFNATFENDKPLFQSLYRTKELSDSRQTKINLNNWQDIPDRWPRKWANGS